MQLSIEDLPKEVMAEELFTNFELTDLLQVGFVSRGFWRLTDHDSIWHFRCEDDHKVVVHKSNCKTKYKIMYLFNLAICYLDARLRNQAMVLFTKVKSMIDSLGPIHQDDKAWIGYRLGFMNLSGYGVTLNKEDGLSCLHASAELQNAKAMTLLALVYLYPALGDYLTNSRISSILARHCQKIKGVDYKEGMKWLRKASCAGCSDAVSVEAEIYLDGSQELGIQREGYQKAIEICTSAIDKGGSECAYLLASYYHSQHEEKYRGRHEELFLQMIEEIISRYTHAANIGSADAALILCDLNLGGTFRGILWPEIQRTNYDEALKWLKKAALLRDSRACYKLGFIYRDGSLEFSPYEPVKAKNLTVKPDINQAIKFFELGAKDFRFSLKVEKCLIALAEIYTSEKYDVKCDPLKAAEYCQRGVRFNSKDSLLCLGRLYLNDYQNAGWKRDLTKAEECFEKALYVNKIAWGSIAREIAQIYASFKDNATTVNLKHFMKWTFRGLKLREKQCVHDLTRLFSWDVPHEKKPCAVDIDDQALFDRFVEMLNYDENGNKKYSLLTEVEICELASECNKILGLPLVKDEFLIDKAEEQDASCMALKIQNGL